MADATAQNEDLQHTPLHSCHEKADARLVDFAGWHMPVQYAGVIEEHRAVRTAAGLFDVSHMGEIRVAGPGAEAFLARLCPNDATQLVPGQAHYSALLTENGTYVDDLLIYRRGDDEFLLVVNASNAAADLAWIEERAAGEDGVTVEDVSDRWALLALQGPKAVEILEPLTPQDLSEIRYYRFAEGTVDGAPVILSRTGYTGEDGFELYTAPEDAARLWDLLLERGAATGLVPAGLGARDTLRLEAGMALYGHEIDADTTPWEAGLAWTVKLGRDVDFVGRQALEAQKEAGVSKKLVGLEVLDRGIARQGYPVFAAADGDGEPVGVVTSGTWSPTFEKALAMAYVPPELAEPGTEVAVGVRSRRLAARVVPLPFYRRPK